MRTQRKNRINVCKTHRGWLIYYVLFLKHRYCYGRCSLGGDAIPSVERIHVAIRHDLKCFFRQEALTDLLNRLPFAEITFDSECSLPELQEDKNYFI